MASEMPLVILWTVWYMVTLIKGMINDCLSPLAPDSPKRTVTNICPEIMKGPLWEAASHLTKLLKDSE